MAWTFRRTLLFCFCALVLALGGVSAYLGTVMIGNRVYAEAQERVRSNLLVARAVYDARINHVLSTVRICCELPMARRAVMGKGVDTICAELARVRVENALDFLSVCDGGGTVRLRAAPPFQRGDSLGGDELIMRALRGETVAGTHIFSRDELAREAEGLEERAYTVVEETPMARPRREKAETSGMVLVAACPVRDARGDLIGAVYGGQLLNRNDGLVDQIRDAAFPGGEQYEGKPLGNVTLFLDDVRIATNVLTAGGNRAIGSRVSKQVYESTVEKGKAWSARAFVVNDWYLAAYVPIRDAVTGRVIGMFYMGLLAEKYDDERTAALGKFLLVIGAGIAAALVISCVLAYRLSAPITRLVRASGRLSSGELGLTVDETTHFTEAAGLTSAFNEMSKALKRNDDALRAANEALKVANRNYMEMLGFVTHELKSPLASVTMNLDTLKKGLVGGLNEKQAHVLRSIIRNVNYFEEMIKNYLDLSRIEKGELQVEKRTIDLRSDVVDPVVANLQDQFDAKKMVVAVDIPPGATLNADPDLLKIVYDNLLSNAAKYGAEGGRVDVGFEESAEQLRLNVRNEGKGIRPDRLGQLFRKFSRLPEEAQAKQKGTGLGLFISREIVEKHGGAIRAESEPDRWADFIFEIPKDAV